MSCRSCRNPGRVASGATASFARAWAACLTWASVGSWSAVSPYVLARLRDLAVGIERLDDGVGDLGERHAARSLADARVLVGAALLVQAGQPARQRRQHVGVGAAHGHVLQERLERRRSCLRSSGWVSASGVSVIPTQSTMTKWVLAWASGVTACSSVGSMTRTPRPFICSKSTRLLTERMNITISTGLMSVPVAIMSTVTAMRGS